MRAGRNDPCPCGSGLKYKKCHLEHDQKQDAASRGSDVSLHERNVTLVAEVAGILGITAGKDWGDVKREISADNVRAIYKVVGELWPESSDTDALLPEPDGSLRALYMGDVTPTAMVQNVTRLGLYADQVLIFNPLHGPHTFSGEYDPTRHPEQWLSDTLKLSYFLIFVAPWIHAGIVELIPSPFDYDARVRKFAYSSAEQRFKQPEYADILRDTSTVEASFKEDWQRSFFRTPPDTIAADLRRKGQGEAMIADFLNYIEEMKRADPLFLDQPIADGGEVLGQRTGANLETGLYVAQLTGAFPYTNLPGRWKELELSKDELPESSAPWSPLSRAFDELSFDFLNDVPASFAVGLREDGRLESFRTFLRRVWNLVSEENDGNRMESVARDFAAELVEEHKKSEADWRDISTQAGTRAFKTTGAAVVAGAFKPEFAIPGYGITLVAELIDLKRKRRSFRDRNPMSVFVDLRRSPVRKGPSNSRRGR